MPLNEFLRRFRGVKKNSSGHIAICPVHEDKTPSLSITIGKSGNVLLHCHAGCEIDRILDAVGLTTKDLYPAAAGRRIKTYDYRDENGVLLYQAVRSEPKRFYQRRPDGDGWANNLNGTRRVLYRLPELLQADRSFPVFIVEGEKDVDRLREIGVTATCNPQGAGKWKGEYGKFLTGLKCVILPDNDDPGEQHAATVAKSLLPHAESVNILRLPDLPDKGDVSDWIARGNTSEDLYALFSGAETINDRDEADNPTRETKTNQRQNSGAKAPSQAAVLMRLAEPVELFHTPDGEGFATIAVNSHKETYALRSGDFRKWLSFQYWNEERTVPSSQSVQDVVHGLGGRAIFEAETKTVNLRLAESGGNLYLDLANDRWQSVEITKDSWNVIDNSPVKFRRARGTMAFPTPEHGGDIDDLKEFVNVADEDRCLLLAWLIAAFRPDKPFPVLVLHGEQGSGKSTTARVIRLLTDPNKASLRSTPKDEHNLMIAANNSWVISLDNLSSLRPEMSDALCRLSTGGGFSTRELYSDGDEILMNLMRPIILNGIDEGVATRSDLLDRSILLHLPRLSRRFDETTFWADFEAARPRLLGSLLDAVVVALSKIDEVTKTARDEKTDLPRLADFTLWTMAAETALGKTQGQFLDRYGKNREAVHDLVLDCDSFAEAILRIMSGRDRDRSVSMERMADRSLRGTAADVLADVLVNTTDDVKREKNFPKTPQAVGKRLSLLAPNLRKHGIDAVPPDRSKRERSWTLKKLITANEPQ